MTAVVQLDGLEVVFGSRPILKGLSAAWEGRALGLLGPNGAGKTTLLHTILGFHAPRRGTVRVFGQDIRTHAREIRAQVGYMPENDAFIAGMSAVRFVRLMAELAGLPPRQALERAHETLFWVGLGEARYRPIESYSLGMKQMVKLAQAIVHGPKLVILDEPTNGLDPQHRQRMIGLIREIRAHDGMHLILSSHLLRDVEESCEEVLVLKDGAIAAQCDLAAERRSNKRLLELETRGDQAGFVTALAALGCDCATTARQRLKLVLPAQLEIKDVYRVASERRIEIRRLQFKQDSLEDIFLKAMGENHVRL